jgi:hypothetical protein
MYSFQDLFYVVFLDGDKPFFLVKNLYQINGQYQTNCKTNRATNINLLLKEASGRAGSMNLGDLGETRKLGLFFFLKFFFFFFFFWLLGLFFFFAPCNELVFFFLFFLLFLITST